MPRVAEEEEQMLGGQQQPTTGMARQQPPSLPLAPAGLGLEQLKRRHIVASLVHSENNYVASLQRLVNVSIQISGTPVKVGTQKFDISPASGFII